MKRRETKRTWEDAGLSPLVRAGARWLSFARGVSSGARRRPRALAFVESLYGAKFKAVEGRGFSFDKVYRAVGGGVSVSETHLSVSVHPRFDLRVLNVFAGSFVSQSSRETAATTPLSHAGAGRRGQVLQRTHIAAPSTTVQTWNVLPATGGRTLPTFGYINVRGQSARQTRAQQSSRPFARGEAMKGTGAETSRTVFAPAASAVVPAASNLQPTSLNFIQPLFDASRQEFVSVLLNTYLPAAAPRAASGVGTAGVRLAAPARRAAAQSGTVRRFFSVPDTQGHPPAAWTYAAAPTRHAPGDAVEVRREFRSFETTKAQVPEREARPSMLHVLAPESLLLSFNLSETSPASRAGVAGHVTYQLGGRAPSLTLQQLRTQAAPRVIREGAPSGHAARGVEQASQPLPAVTREVLSSLSTFVRHVQTSVAGVTHAGHTTNFTRQGFGSASHRIFEQVPAPQREASSASLSGRVTTRELRGLAVEFVRPASFTVFAREAPAEGAGAQTTLDGRRDFFSTEGAGTFLFVTALMRRSGAAAGALSQTAATALRLVAAAEEAGRPLKETRAARPEGMALELIRQRREQVLQPARPGYVFTQPPRTQLEERQVITKASREEIVEVVRKEVRSLGAAAQASAAPSRADIAAVADEVYSTLVRRLLVEKERLGRF